MVLSTSIQILAYGSKKETTKEVSERSNNVGHFLGQRLTVKTDHQTSKEAPQFFGNVQVLRYLRA